MGFGQTHLYVRLDVYGLYVNTAAFRAIVKFKFRDTIMHQQNVTQASRALLQAWDNGVERALNNTARDDELAHAELNNVAGLRVESGIKGGLWGVSGKHTCISCQCSDTCS